MKNHTMSFALLTRLSQQRISHIALFIQWAMYKLLARN